MYSNCQYKREIKTISLQCKNITILFCTALHSTKIYFPKLTCTVLYFKVVSCHMLHCTTLYHTTVQSIALKYTAVQYYSILVCCTAMVMVARYCSNINSDQGYFLFSRFVIWFDNCHLLLTVPQFNFSHVEVQVKEELPLQ